MLSSQQRNIPDNKLCLCKHAMSLLSGLKPCRPTAQQSGVAAHHQPMQSHCFIFMPSPSSRSMAKPTGSMVAIALFYLKQVQHSVLKPPQSLRMKCPMAGKKIYRLRIQPALQVSKFTAAINKFFLMMFEPFTTEVRGQQSIKPLMKVYQLIE